MILHWHCSMPWTKYIIMYVKLILVVENLCENCFISHYNDFYLIPLGTLGEMCFFE